VTAKVKRCAVYTRKSSEEGLEQAFNSLDAQREACEAYIKSQAHEGWKLVKTAYDDGGFSGGSMERPALRRLLVDLRQGLVDVVVVYKIDRLTRSLADFARIVETLDRQGASFVSITQQFNTTTSMGRLTLNVLLSFAQFEREVTGERKCQNEARRETAGKALILAKGAEKPADRRTLSEDNCRKDREKLWAAAGGERSARLAGWGTRIRTWTNRVRAGCSTVKLSPKRAGWSI
jgi:DNA invertase Pin-like site-specific DNA recombinase